MIQYKPELRLRYDSSPKQIRGIIDDIKCMLEEHARVLKDIIRVRFTNFESDAILIKVHCYVNSTEVSEFLEIAEELNLKIMEIVDAHSASFALPGRMIYGGQGPQAQGA
jgi:MscS family membrane protein